MDKKLTPAKLLTIITFIAVFLIGVRPPVDTDMYWHLSAGKWAVENGEIPRTDQFSHTHFGEEWINHGGAIQPVLYWMYEGLGDLGLVLFTAVLGLIGMTFVYKTLPGDALTKAVTMILASATATIFWVTRPLMVSFALSGVLFFILTRWRQGKIKHLWGVIGLMVVWVNLHGAGVNGFILLVLFAIGEGANWLMDDAIPAWRSKEAVPKPAKTLHIIWVGLASAAVSALNPYGLRMLYYPFFTAQMEAARQFIQEWQSPDFHNPQTLPFLIMLLATFVLAGLSSKKLTWGEIVLVVGTAFVSFNSQRLIPTFAIVTAPTLAKHFDAWVAEQKLNLNWERPPSRVQNFLNWFLIGILVLAGLVQVYKATDPLTLEPLRTELLPIEAVEALNELNPPGKLFNSYNWGGYLTWAAQDHPVYIDGRADLMGDPHITRYLSITFAQKGWQEKLAEDGIQTILIEANSPLAIMLAVDENWVEMYRDELAVVFVRE